MINPSDVYQLPLRLPHYAYYEEEILKEDFICQMRYMPYYVLSLKEREIGIAFSELPGVSEMMNMAGHLWWNTARWLEFYDFDAPPPTSGRGCKPLAELSSATYKLIKEIIAYNSWEGNKYPLSQLHFRLAYEQHLCELVLTDAGVFGDEVKPIGAKKHYQNTLQRNATLILSAETQKLNKINRDPNITAIKYEDFELQNLRPVEAVESLAWYLASIDSEFRSTHYATYLQSVNSCARQLGNGGKSSGLTSVYLINGCIKKLGVGRGTGSRQSKRK